MVSKTRGRHKIEILNRSIFFYLLPSEFVQPDGERPSTSRHDDDDDDNEEPDDLSDPLSSTGTEQPGNIFIKIFFLSK